MVLKISHNSVLWTKILSTLNCIIFIQKSLITNHNNKHVVNFQLLNFELEQWSTTYHEISLFSHKFHLLLTNGSNTMPERLENNSKTTNLMHETK